MENWIKQITKTYRNMITEERDAEGQMAKGELQVMAKKAQELAAMMQDDTQLEAWVQSKITKAKDYISSVHDYMNGNPDKVD
jgi:serine protease inhibitor